MDTARATNRDPNLPSPGSSQPISSEKGLSLALTLMESATSNWAQGDQTLFAFTFTPVIRNQVALGPLLCRYSGSLRIGATHVDDSLNLGFFRVTDDIVAGEGVLTWPLGWKVDPYLSLGFHTQVTEQFLYTPQGRFRIAKIWDPVTSQEGLGLAFGKTTREITFNSRIGFSLQQIRAHDHILETDDITTPGIETYKAQAGIESSVDATILLDSSTSYIGRLSLFSTYRNIDVWTVRSSNEFRFRIWKWFGISCTVMVVHDILQSRRTQIQQSLMLGIFQNL